MKRRIYLDMDGVIADLYKAVRKANRIPSDYVQQVNIWDFTSAFGQLIDLDRHSIKWWANVPRTLECSSIIEMAIAYVGIENVCVATSAMGRPNAAAGKMAWISYNANFLKHRLCILDDKSVLAKSEDDILIDDSNHQTEAWEAAGGTAILVPRIWNKRHLEADTALACVEHGLMDIMRRGGSHAHG
jgi:5'(3')-deoxyribonucleotidase